MLVRTPSSVLPGYFRVHEHCLIRTLEPQSIEVEQTLKRIQSHRGVQGILIADVHGRTIKTTMSEAEANKVCAPCPFTLNIVRGQRLCSVVTDGECSRSSTRIDFC